MTFVHPLLLGGLVLIGIPVLIHLIMQQKPKRLLFPAFRFLKQRYRTNQSKLRLRHLLLLALRMLLIAALCLALSRPKLYSERLNLSSDRPVTVALLFDTSYSMEYRVAERSRLDEARRRAGEVLDQLPEGSRVVVLDSAEVGGEWQTSMARAREQIAHLQLRHANAPVTRQLAQAYRLLDNFGEEQGSDNEPPPRFLYVFSDRTPESWNAADVKALPQAPSAGIHAVFVDVGVDHPADLAITNVELPKQLLGLEDRLDVQVTVQATGTDADTFLTCAVDGETPGEQKPLRLSTGQTRKVSFERPLDGLKPGTHRVEVRLGANDSLPFNDTRFATFEVRGGRKVLALADDPHDARAWELALGAHHDFRCDRLKVGEATKRDPKKLLAEYKAICLIDVKEPTRDLWALLEVYVQKGGGLAVVPGGDELILKAYDDDAAQRLLPGRLKQLLAVEGGPGVSWSEDDPPHLFLVPFREWRRTASVDFYTPQLLPRVFHYWEVPRPEVGTIVTYADEKKRPALLERFVGLGRVLLFTTGFDARKNPNSGPFWNNYLEGSFFVVVINETMAYLAGDTARPNFNYLAGQAVPVPLPAEPRFPLYTFEGAGVTGSVPRSEEQKQLQITQAVTPGNYTVHDGNHQVVAGFSVNVRPEESQLGRDPELVTQIETVLGPDSVLPLGHTTSLHEALQKHWRQPVELLPWLMIGLLLLLALESLLGNRFYRRPKEEA